MNAETIAKALGGRRSGKGWLARCIAHDDRTPSLSLCDADNGRVLVHCHAGCDQHVVIARLKASDLWSHNERRPLLLVKSNEGNTPSAHSDQSVIERTKSALSIWQNAKPADGSLIETYLRSRGLRLPVGGALRFHPSLRHPCGSCWPSMIGLVSSGADGRPLAIHRTYLDRNGGGKAPVNDQKLMLGPCSGGAVRLAEPGEVLMIGEGIETCLAAMQVIGQPAWAALSTSGLRALDLPYFVRNVIVLADGDDSGESAANDCALRLRRGGRQVRIARAPRGMDFNDVLLSEARCNQGVLS